MSSRSRTKRTLFVVDEAKEKDHSDEQWQKRTRDKVVSDEVSANLPHQTSIEESPLKKQRQIQSSIRSVRVLITPEKVEGIEHFTKTGKASSSSSSTTTRRRIVSPQKQHAKIVPSSSSAVSKKNQEQQQYVPTYIHKNLSYKRKGMAVLEKNIKKAYSLVEEYFIIPNDFENNRSYGPLSGTCFERRVIRAYKLGLLKAKKKDKIVDICSHCGILGHIRDDCSELI